MIQSSFDNSNKTRKLEIIQKIIHDKAFSDSGSYEKLLNYLFECTEKNYIPSETDIATQVFQKDKSFDPTQDPFVRVYISKLRKKFDSFYETTGKDDPVRVIIPRGRYRVEFVPTAVESTKAAIFLKFLFQHWALILLVVAVIVILVQLTATEKNKVFNAYTEFGKNHPVWTPFLADGADVIYTFEDVYTFYEFDEALQRNRLIKDGAIRSLDDLRRYEYEHNRKIILPNWNPIPEISAIGLKWMAPIFLFNELNYDVMLTSQLTWEDLNTKNIVFSGQYQNMYKVGEFMPKQIKITHSESDELTTAQMHVDVSGDEYSYYYSPSEYDKVRATHDYVVLALVPGPQNRKILIIASWHTVGRKEVIGIITDPDRQKHVEFFQQFDCVSNSTPYFAMVIQVNGYEKTSTQSKVLHVLPLGT